jgi:hypothetical protein
MMIEHTIIMLERLTKNEGYFRSNIAYNMGSLALK